MTASKPQIWYAVHLLFALERKKAPRYLVFEDVFLVVASSFAMARRRALAIGRSQLKGYEGFHWDGKPVRALFSGVRKIVTCAPDVRLSGESEVTKVHDGMEATYSQFLVKGKRELRRMVAGNPVAVVYEE